MIGNCHYKVMSKAPKADPGSVPRFHSQFMNHLFELFIFLQGSSLIG